MCPITGQVYIVDRFTVCVADDYGYAVPSKNPGESTVAGTLRIVAVIETDRSSGQFQARWTITPLSVDGFEQLPSLRREQIECKNGCTVLQEKMDPVPLGDIGQSYQRGVRFGNPSYAQDGFARSLSGSLKWRIYTLQLLEHSVNLSTPPIRCDKNPVHPYRRPGCVLEGTKPTVTFRHSEEPEYYNHVTQSIRSGTPSEVMRDPTAKRANRRACGRERVRVDGLQCDEYPFATVREGAGFWPAANAGRTFPPGCGPISSVAPFDGATRRGYSLCFIPGQQNRSAGTRLNGFYVANRIVAGDVFLVSTSWS